MESQIILENLFDSKIKIRLLKMFLRNPNDLFTEKDIKEKLIIKANEEEEFKKELKKLTDIELFSVSKNQEKEKTYVANSNFTFFEEVKNIVLRSSPVDRDNLARRIRQLGKTRVSVLSGVFLGSENKSETRADILVVSDVISEKRFEAFIKSVESEVGVEIKYALLSTEDYDYRMRMFDRFLKDIFDKPHVILTGRDA